MNITLTLELKEAIEKLFTKQQHLACAKAIVSRIYLKHVTQDDNIASISKGFCLIFVGHHAIIYNNKKMRETSYILTILELNKIIEKMWDACPKHNSPAFYKINPLYLELKDTIKIDELLKDILSLKLYKTVIKNSKLFLDKSNSNIYNKRNLDINWSENYTNLLKERYLNNFSFNSLNILAYIRKEWNDNTITDYDNLKINTYRQLQIVHSIYFIQHPLYLSVHVGNIGGRLHHQLCSMVKEIWLLIYTFIQGNVKLSIDVTACQVYCFLKYFGPMPLPLHNSLGLGQFYEYINDTYYKGKKTRLNIKKIIFSRFFNGAGKIWKDLSKTYPLYAERVLKMIHSNKLKEIKTAGILQRMLSNLFNNLLKDIDNSIIRYDLIIVSVLLKDIDNTISLISSIIDTYFNTYTNIYILIDNNTYTYITPYRAQILLTAIISELNEPEILIQPLAQNSVSDILMHRAQLIINNSLNRPHALMTNILNRPHDQYKTAILTKLQNIKRAS